MELMNSMGFFMFLLHTLGMGPPSYGTKNQLAGAWGRGTSPMGLRNGNIHQPTRFLFLWISLISSCALSDYDKIRNKHQNSFNIIQFISRHLELVMFQPPHIMGISFLPHLQVEDGQQHPSVGRQVALGSVADATILGPAPYQQNQLRGHGVQLRGCLERLE